jgi:TolB-like protein
MPTMLLSDKLSFRVLILCILIIFSATAVYSQQKLPVAVMEFKVTKLPQDEVELMIDFLNNALFETGVFDVIQKSRRDHLIKEIEFSYSDMSDSAKNRELGKLLASQFLIFGSIGQLGKHVLFNLTTVDVETGQTVSTYSRTYSQLDEIVDDFEQIAGNIARFASRLTFLKKAELLLVEDFEKPGDWLETELLYYEDGWYHIYSPEMDYYTWKHPVFDDFVYEAEARWVEGEEDFGYGILFRVQDDDNYYLFDITQTGYFKLDKKVDGNYSDITSWEPTSAINTAGKNILKVEALGKNITLYINNFKVKEVVDGTFHSGEFGFFAGGNVHAAFDNVKIYRGNLLLYNNFSRGPEDWVVDEIAGVRNGEYRLAPSEGGYYSWRAEELQNASFKAETRWLSGSTNMGYGLIFRLQDIDNHYFFLITKNGYYKLGMYNEGGWYDLIDWQKSRFINEVGKNTLKVEMYGSQFKLYINGNHMEDYIDNTFSEGKVGFVSLEDVNIAFDNVEIFLLD